MNQCVSLGLSHLVSRNSLDSVQRAYGQQSKKLGTMPRPSKERFHVCCCHKVKSRFQKDERCLSLVLNSNANSSNSFNDRFPLTGCSFIQRLLKVAPCLDSLLVVLPSRQQLSYHSFLSQSKPCAHQRLTLLGSCLTWTLSALYGFRISRSIMEIKRLNTSVLFANFDKARRGATGCCSSFRGFLD